MADEIKPEENDAVILDYYPLPVAHEYRQLVEKREWRSKCRQLIDLLDFSLRYCVVIAVSNYFEGQSIDEQLDQWLVRKLVNPELKNLPEILSRIMVVYQSQMEKLYMSELYPFCFDPEGNRSAELKLVEQIIEGFVKPLLSGYDPIRPQESYETYAPQVKELLIKMAFLKDYILLRMIGPREGNKWIFHKLMGWEIQENIETWEEDHQPNKPGIALWSSRHQRLLPLHPFALFEECQECSAAFHWPPAELFLYKGVKEDEVIYFGLREDSVGLTHRLHSKEMLKEIRYLLPVETWPPAKLLPDEMQSKQELAKVFLCHASEDKPRVQKLYYDLKSAGLVPWLDEFDILPGQDWEYEIQRAIWKSDFFGMSFKELN